MCDNSESNVCTTAGNLFMKRYYKYDEIKLIWIIFQFKFAFWDYPLMNVNEICVRHGTIED